MSNRPTWDEYFLGLAKSVSLRADCSRRRVGAILVTVERRHRGSGYNGARSEGASCLAGQCPRGQMSAEELAHDQPSYDDVGSPGFCIAIHAEMNVIMDTTPADRKYGTIYITDEPCPRCIKELHACGVSRLVWPEGQWVKDGKHWVKQYFEQAIPPVILPLR